MDFLRRFASRHVLAVATASLFAAGFGGACAAEGDHGGMTPAGYGGSYLDWSGKKAAPVAAPATPAQDDAADLTEARYAPAPDFDPGRYEPQTPRDVPQGDALESRYGPPPSDAAASPRFAATSSDDAYAPAAPYTPSRAPAAAAPAPMSAAGPAPSAAADDEPLFGPPSAASAASYARARSASPPATPAEASPAPAPAPAPAAEEPLFSPPPAEPSPASYAQPPSAPYRAPAETASPRPPAPAPAADEPLFPAPPAEPSPASYAQPPSEASRAPAETASPPQPAPTRKRTPAARPAPPAPTPPAASYAPAPSPPPAAERAQGTGSVRYYSLHREYGKTPDAIPAPTEGHTVLIGPPDPGAAASPADQDQADQTQNGVGDDSKPAAPAAKPGAGPNGDK